MKYIKIVLINIFLIVFIFIFFDWLLYSMFYFEKVKPIDISLVLDKTRKFIQPLDYSPDKRPIVVMGCSFANGFGLEQKDTLAYKIQKFTKRQTFNYSKNGHGIQHVLYKIQNSNFFNEINPDPEYVIYVFMDDHLRRMYKEIFTKFK